MCFTIQAIIEVVPKRMQIRASALTVSVLKFIALMNVMPFNARTAIMAVTQSILMAVSIIDPSLSRFAYLTLLALNEFVCHITNRLPGYKTRHLIPCDPRL
jgi:hypothetical protein